MPVEYALDGNLLTMKFVGKYDPSDVRARFLEALADPNCPARVALLVDVSQSESLQSRMPEEIRAIAEFLGPNGDRISRRCAVVADSDVLYGLCRMGAVYTETVGVHAEIFRDVQSALDWLSTFPPAPGGPGPAEIHP